MRKRKPSYIKNCYIKPKQHDTLFEQFFDNSIRVTLDGYAIIPIEEYERLLKEAGYEQWKII